MISRILVLLLIAFPATAARATEITRVWTEWRDAGSFVRLSELVDGKENPGSEIYLRSQPDSRDGFYFLVRLAVATPIDGTFEARVIMPGKMKPVSYKFPASVKGGSSVYQIGLTGSDWPDRKVKPVAWRISLLDSSGKEIVAKESFLWSPPK